MPISASAGGALLCMLNFGSIRPPFIRPVTVDKCVLAHKTYENSVKVGNDVIVILTNEDMKIVHSNSRCSFV